MKHFLIAITFLVTPSTCSTALASPFPPYNKPVSINWWQASCKQGYAVPENQYAKGYCDGVIYSSLNNLDQWCVPEDVTWGEVVGLLVNRIKEAKFRLTTSSANIVNWIDSTLKTKWPCEG